MAFQMVYNLTTTHSSFEVKVVSEVKTIDCGGCVEFILPGDQIDAGTVRQSSNLKNLGQFIAPVGNDASKGSNIDAESGNLKNSKKSCRKLSSMNIPKLDTILYILKGRNNFMNYHLHLKNFEQYSHHNIIISFEEVYEHDGDYMAHYEKLVKNALELENIKK